MKRRYLAGAAVLALGCLLAIPQPSHAQRYYRGGSGFGFSVGGPNYNFVYGNAPGWNGGYYGYGGSSYPRSYNNYGYGYGSYPYGSRYYYEPRTFQAAPAVTFGSPIPSTTYQSAYPSMQGDQNRDPNVATVRLRLPSDARLWLGEQEMSAQQQGNERVFVTPSLTPGTDYFYRVKAQWTENGQTVERSRRVAVRAGESISVDLTNAAADTNP
jgi:uncharacterized protein (TIGR03000 family)